MARLPMFPLGTVLLPGEWLPLQVFEPRYLALVERCLATTPEFGVVLIERGHEVGGGDVRTGAGTVARITDVRRVPDGRLLVQAMGARRIRVAHWLPDDPHPLAEVEEWPDEPGLDDLAVPLAGTTNVLRRVLALRAELDEPGPEATFEVAEHEVVASYQLCALAPLGPLDRHRLLTATTVASRLELLHELLVDEAEVLTARLAGG